MLQCFAVRCGVLRCVTVCCGVLRRVAVCCGVLRRNAACAARQFSWVGCHIGVYIYMYGSETFERKKERERVCVGWYIGCNIHTHEREIGVRDINKGQRYMYERETNQEREREREREYVTESVVGYQSLYIHVWERARERDIYEIEIHV